MKKLLAIFTLCTFAIGASAQPYTWESISGGSWINPATWNNIDNAPYDYPQTTDDIVTIKNTLFPVALGIDVNLNSITIDTEGTNQGIFLINSNLNVSTTENFIMMSNGVFPSTLLVSDGVTIKVGDGTEDGLIVDGLINITGASEINVGGFFRHIGGKISLTSDLMLNVAEQGAIPVVVDEQTLYIGSQAEYQIGTGNINFTINVKNGNLGTNEEIYIENATVTNSSTEGQTTLNLQNTDGADNNYTFLTDLNLGTVNIDIGTGNTVVFDNLTDPPTEDVFFKELNVISGEFEMATGSLLTVDPASSGL